MNAPQSADRITLIPAEEMQPVALPWLTEAYAALDGRGGAVTPLTSSLDLLGAAGDRWPGGALSFIELPSSEPCGFIVVERGSPRTRSLALSSRAKRGISCPGRDEIPRSARDDRVPGRGTPSPAEKGNEGATGIVIVHALAIRRADRNLGYGVDVVALLEAAEWADRVLAPIPRSNGLAIYFWLRAGYRPVRDEDDPARSRDPEHLWMVRERAFSAASQGP